MPDAENGLPEPEQIGARVLDRHGFAYTRFSDSEAHSEGDWINEDALIVQWEDIDAPRPFPPAESDVPRPVLDVARIKAEAWDEGYDARGEDIANEGLVYTELTPNPYSVIPPADRRRVCLCPIENECDCAEPVGDVDTAWLDFPPAEGDE